MKTIDSSWMKKYSDAKRAKGDVFVSDNPNFNRIFKKKADY